MCIHVILFTEIPKRTEAIAPRISARLFVWSLSSSKGAHTDFKPTSHSGIATYPVALRPSSSPMRDPSL